MSYFRTCPICGAHLDPGEACDCLTVYTGYPGGTHVSMNIEAGEIGHCSIYIGKDEPSPGAGALTALEDRIKETALSATNTGDGKAEQIDKAVSASIVTENKEDCKR